MRLRALGAAGLAVCAGSGCSDAVGPYTAAHLDVWAEVTPNTVSIADTSAAFTIRVHVYNPNNHTVVIKGGPPYVFTWDPAKTQGLEEQFRIANETSPLNAGPNISSWGHPQYVFPPHRGEYSEYVVTLKEWKKGGWPLAPGDYTVRAWYNKYEGKSASLRLTQ